MMTTKLVNGDRVEVSEAEESKLRSDQMALAKAKSEDLKNEAERRIVTICPEWKQRNTLARALILVKKVLLDGKTLTEDELADVIAMEDMFGQIDAHRDASNRLEAGSIPIDFEDDKHWP